MLGDGPGFSRLVLFLFLGLLRAPTRNSPERVRDTFWTFPQKSGKHRVWNPPPGLASLKFQEWPRQTKPKKGQFMNFSQGHSGTKVQCESCLFCQGKTPEFTQKWAKFMNFSFWPFFWFGLPGRLFLVFCVLLQQIVPRERNSGKMFTSTWAKNATRIWPKTSPMFALQFPGEVAARSSRKIGD